MPARRSSSASATCTTPSQSAPPRTAARAAGTAPWPYPLAFTTAMTAAGATCARSAAMFLVIAPRSTLASAWLSMDIMLGAARGTRAGPAPRGPRSARAAGSPATSAAPIGAAAAARRRGRRRPPRRAWRPARAGTRPQIAACGGSRPWASSAPASPARTSPVPAVASHGVPVVLTSTGSSAVRRRDHRGRALEQHARAEPVRRAPRVLEPPRLDVGRVRAEQPAELARVRGDQRGRGPRQQLPVPGEQGQPVRVDQHRQAGGEHRREPPRRRVVGAHARARRPTPAPGPRRREPRARRWTRREPRSERMRVSPASSVMTTSG